MTSNQIIKELLTRLYIYDQQPEYLDVPLDRDCAKPRKPLSLGPLGSRYHHITEAGISIEETRPTDEWLNVALGGEAKALWDIVNEKPVDMD